MVVQSHWAYRRFRRCFVALRTWLAQLRSELTRSKELDELAARKHDSARRCELALLNVMPILRVEARFVLRHIDGFGEEWEWVRIQAEIGGESC